MSMLDKYNKVFKDVFSLDDSVDVSALTFQGISAWDSIGHMNLIAGLEEAYDIRFEIDDIIDFSSYQKGIEILNKLGVNIK